MEQMSDKLQTLSRPNAPDLCYYHSTGATDRPGLLWLGGYASDMEGTKAQFLHQWAKTQNISFTRFDYRGHGKSGGKFEDGTISLWAEDGLAILDQVTQGAQILVGSSMGAWIACLIARQKPERLAGMVLIAPAPDFTTALIPNEWPAARFLELEKKGRVEIPSDYDETVMVYTKALFDDGKKSQVLNQPLAVSCPVKILQGMADAVVPWTHAMGLAEHIEAPQVSVHLEKNSDHRFSGTHELALIGKAILEIEASSGQK